VFYVWAAIFNLYLTTVFWALVVDVFGERQSRRLFGFIAGGGSVGAILGSTITATLVARATPAGLLLVSAALLEVAVWLVYLLSSGLRGTRAARPSQPAPPAARVEPPTGRTETVIGGSAWAGITRMLRSPYLLGICAFMLLFTIGSTFLYVQQARIVEANFADRAVRTAFFARVDLAVNVITLVGQIWLFPRLMRWIGVTGMLALIPALSVGGFLALAAAPTLAVLVGFNVLRRAGNFAVARPTREVLYTVIPREDKYKAKSFVDTFVYRLGDQIGVWGEAALGALGLGIAGVSLVAAPLSFLWMLVAVWLGRQQRRLAGPAINVENMAAAPSTG
jgi:AAA family ATP:ADP antiporter